MNPYCVVFPSARAIAAAMALCVIWVIVVSSPARAAGHAALIEPVPLQTLKTDKEAQKLAGSLRDAVNRVPGVDAIIVGNDANKASVSAFLLDGGALSATGLVSSTPPPVTDYSTVVQNPAGGTASDAVTITGKNITLTPVGVATAKPETILGVPDYLVQPTLVIDPADNSNLTLYIFVTRHNGGITQSCSFKTTGGGAAALNKLLSKVSLAPLFETAAPINFGTVLVIPIRSTDVAYSARVHDRLASAHLSTIPRNDVSLLDTSRADLAAACAANNARTILAWGIENDKEPLRFGYTGYHAHVTFDLLNCLPTDYGPPSFSTGILKKRLTNIPGVIASLGVILQTATRMTIAPIANVLSGSSILAIFPTADETQNTQKTLDEAIGTNVNKLCAYLASVQEVQRPEGAQWAYSVPSPRPAVMTCDQYAFAIPKPTSTPTPTPSYAPTTAPSSSGASPAPAFYIVREGGGALRGIRLRLESADLIAKANDLLKSPGSAARHVRAKIALGPVSYERGWGFHIEPSSVSFFDIGNDTGCNKSLSEIKANLSAVGGSFLPGAIWCPWDSYITRDTQPWRTTGNPQGAVKRHVTSARSPAVRRRHKPNSGPAKPSYDAPVSTGVSGSNPHSAHEPS